MALLKIARMGHPVLSAPAKPVEDMAAPDIHRLVADMAETLADAGGVGLAAPQVHVPLRLVIYHIPANRTEDGIARPLTVLANPVLTPLSEQRFDAFEGCLSLPGMTGVVPRYGHIRVQGLDLGGNPVDHEARGFHARVLQHECDHLDGVLYPMRMATLATFGFVEEMQRGRPAEATEETTP